MSLQVTWYREGHDRITTSKYIFTTSDLNGTKHTLRFNRIRDVDFGVYICKSENLLGQAQVAIEISGIFHQKLQKKIDLLIAHKKKKENQF